MLCSSTGFISKLFELQQGGRSGAKERGRWSRGSAHRVSRRIRTPLTVLQAKDQLTAMEDDLALIKKAVEAGAAKKKAH